jgi:Na+/H+ antiporter
MRASISSDSRGLGSVWARSQKRQPLVAGHRLHLRRPTCKFAASQNVCVQTLELVLALLVAVVVISTVAPTLRVPAPILLVLGGLALALIPQVPDVVLAPDFAFVLFLPPLLYSAAFDTSIRDLRAHLQPILSLAIGLVLLTTAAVAVVVHLLVPDVPWPVAFALGAIVSPPDAVAAVAVFRGLGVPRRLVTVLEGESLFNDATALVAYQMAVAAAGSAGFSYTDAVVRFVVVGVGGLLIGVIVGWLVAYLQRRLVDPAVEITISLLTPFGAYIVAEELHVSGVLATVAAGLCAGFWSSDLMAPETRLRSRAVWDMGSFLLNGLVFILIGLQLLRILPALGLRPLPLLIGLGVLISLTVVVVRFGWVFGGGIVARMLARSSSQQWRDRAVVSWAGMRGVVSLATALALPLDIPERDLLIFLTFCVILVTLVGQGLSLPWLVRVLGVSADSGEGTQERRARRAAAEAALVRIDEMTPQWPDHLPLLESLRTQYAHRATHLDEAQDGSPNASEREILEHRQIRRAVLDAERDAVLDLRRRGALDDEGWRHLERDLDLEALRLDA